MSVFSRIWNRVMMGRMSFNDRRRFIRISEHHLLRYRVIDKDEEMSFTRNISVGGVLFHCREQLPQGSMIELDMNLPPYSRPIRAMAKVLRVEPLRKVGGFDIGVEFVSVDEDARNFLDEKIRSFCEKEQNKKK
ncbi:MAG: PilZ domain-containing protein [Candidatus Omnitrophica bacterium]|nr:PilZ domain-containing protein [Candidatus Omnitrophota bacterium]